MYCMNCQIEVDDVNETQCPMCGGPLLDAGAQPLAGGGLNLELNLNDSSDPQGAFVLDDDEDDGAAQSAPAPDFTAPSGQPQAQAAYAVDPATNDILDQALEEFDPMVDEHFQKKKTSRLNSKMLLLVLLICVLGGAGAYYFFMLNDEQAPEITAPAPVKAVKPQPPAAPVQKPAAIAEPQKSTPAAPPAAPAPAPAAVAGPGPDKAAAPGAAPAAAPVPPAAPESKPAQKAPAEPAAITTQKPEPPKAVAAPAAAVAPGPEVKKPAEKAAEPATPAKAPERTAPPAEKTAPVQPKDKAALPAAEPAAAKPAQPAAPVAAAAPAAAKPGRPVYSIMTDSFRSRANADAEMHRLRKLGFDARIMEISLGKKGVFYRVLVGSWAARSEALPVAAELRGKAGKKNTTVMPVVQ